MTNNICFIPARFKSSRLPGKPLLKINNKTIIRRVYEQVKKCNLVNRIIVLTDDKRIYDEVISFKGECFITPDCKNGTERIVNFLKSDEIKIPDYVINVQGDEPYINPVNIDKCIQNFINKKFTNFAKIFHEINDDLKCSTLHYEFTDKEEIHKRSNGKLALDKFNNILFCSRNVIPGSKNNSFDESINYFGHIGVFVFDTKYLMQEYLSRRSPYQTYEDIEWLIILEDGYKINSVLIDKLTHEIGVDTQEDYDYLLHKYNKQV